MITGFCAKGLFLFGGINSNQPNFELPFVFCQQGNGIAIADGNNQARS